MNADDGPDPQDAEFGTVARWTADLVAGRDDSTVLAAACRGSGSPSALAWLAESLRLGPGTTLLDVGAGLAGPLAWAVQHYGVSPVAVEPMTAACQGARQLFGQPAISAPADALPLRNRSVTACWILGVLDTVPDPFAVLREARRVIDDNGRVGLLAYLAARTIAAEDAPRGNHFQRADELDRAVSEAGFLVVDRIEGSGLPDAPVDWQLRQQQVERELEQTHGDDAVWQTAAEQSSRFARLLDRGDLSLTLIHAVAL